MSFIRIYLLAYAALVAAAVLTLWYAGVLPQLPGIWIAGGLLIAATLGILVFVGFRRRPQRPREDNARPVRNGLNSL
jgi:hypothetical protein